MLHLLEMGVQKVKNICHQIPNLPQALLHSQQRSIFGHEMPDGPSLELWVLFKAWEHKPQEQASV